MWTPDQIELMTSMLRAKCDMQAISTRVGKSPSTIRRKMAELGISRPRGGIKALSEEEELDLYVKVKIHKRVSMTEACSEAGISTKTMRRAIHNVHHRFDNNKKRILEAAIALGISDTGTGEDCQ